MTHNEPRRPANNDEPIYTPPPESDRHWLDPEPDKVKSSLNKVGFFIMSYVRAPADWFRHNVVEPNRGEKYYWFHRKYPRVLPIDECYIDDFACIHEADIEYKRIKMVDRATLNMLHIRKENCWFYYKDEKGYDNVRSTKCQDISDSYEREALNFFIKYGELPVKANVVNAYMKQKHRMIVERRRARIQKERQEFSESS